MEYELVGLYPLRFLPDGSLDDSALGYAIKRVGHDKLTGINILTYKEAQAHVEDMNERAFLRKFWPMPTDDEVQELIDDPNFCPVEYDEVDVPDMFQSNLVYDMKPGARVGTDASGNPVFGPDEIKYNERGEPVINWTASEIVYKKERHPKRTQGISRIEAASNHVARRRAAINYGISMGGFERVSQEVTDA